MNPDLKEKGLAMAYNHTDKMIKKAISLPLYYTGLAEVARVREKEAKSKIYHLDRYYDIEIPVRIRAKNYSWLVIE